VVDFRNTVIFMTSNLASDVTMRLAAEGQRSPSADELGKALRPALNRHFKPALLARMTVVPYFPITSEVLQDIIALKLGHVATRMQDSHGASLSFAQPVIAAIAARCQEAETGARNADHIIREHLLPLLSSYVLHHLAEGTMPSTVQVTLDDTGHFAITTEGSEHAPPLAVAV
jgi:type VI secretion system protein VasG